MKLNNIEIMEIFKSRFKQDKREADRKDWQTRKEKKMDVEKSEPK